MPVVFLHSLAGSTSHWSSQLNHARTERRAVAIDLRGHGGSKPPLDGDYSLAAMARDVEAVVDGLSIEQFVLVGHSMGGTVAIEYTGRHDKRVAGLLLVDVAGNPGQFPPEQVSQFLESLESDSYQTFVQDYWKQILVGSTREVRDAVMKGLRNTRKETVVSAFKEALSYNPLPALGRYTGPRLSVITPLNDTPFSLHRVLPDFPFLMITGTSHWLHMDRPDHFNRVLDEFLDQVEMID